MLSLTCILAMGGPEFSLILSLPEIAKSSIHLLTSNAIDVLRGYAHGEGEFSLKIRFLFSEEGRIKERGTERRRIKGMEMRSPSCLFNCGFIVLPWTQLQRGKKSIFFLLLHGEEGENLFVD